MLNGRINKKNIIRAVVVVLAAVVLLVGFISISNYRANQKLDTFENSQFSISKPKGFSASVEGGFIVLASENYTTEAEGVESVKIFRENAEYSEESMTELELGVSTEFGTNTRIPSVRTFRTTVNSMPALKVVRDEPINSLYKTTMYIFSEENLWSVQINYTDDSILEQSIDTILNSFTVN